MTNLTFCHILYVSSYREVRFRNFSIGKPTGIYEHSTNYARPGADQGEGAYFCPETESIYPLLSRNKVESRHEKKENVKCLMEFCANTDREHVDMETKLLQELYMENTNDSAGEPFSIDFLY